MKSDVEYTWNGVSQADLYQLYAYAHRYGTKDNVLLFPEVEGVTVKQYRIIENAIVSDGSKKRVRVEFINLNFDLKKDRARLSRILGEMLS